MEFIKLYFAICLIAYVIDVIAVLAIVFIKPLRLWCWKKYVYFSKEFTEIWLAVWPELIKEDKDENL